MEPVRITCDRREPGYASSGPGTDLWPVPGVGCHRASRAEAAGWAETARGGEEQHSEVTAATARSIRTRWATATNSSLTALVVCACLTIGVITSAVLTPRLTGRIHGDPRSVDAGLVDSSDAAIGHELEGRSRPAPRARAAIERRSPRFWPSFSLPTTSRRRSGPTPGCLASSVRPCSPQRPPTRERRLSMRITRHPHLSPVRAAGTLPRSLGGFAFARKTGGLSSRGFTGEPLRDPCRASGRPARHPRRPCLHI